MTLPVDSVENYIGYDIKVCDHVAETIQSNQPNKITYINFGGHYPENKFTVIIFPRDMDKFDYKPHEYLKGKKICVTGWSSEYKGKPQIVVSHPDQITIMH